MKNIKTLNFCRDITRKGFNCLLDMSPLHLQIRIISLEVEYLCLCKQFIGDTDTLREISNQYKNIFDFISNKKELRKYLRALIFFNSFSNDGIIQQRFFSFW